MDTSWNASWSTAANTLTSSAIRELLKLTEQPDVVSFAGGLPAPECFPAEEIAVATERILASSAARVLQYGPTEGFPPLREFLAALTSSRGAQIDSESVLITSGSQQGLDIIAKLFIDPDAPVLVENPTYLGALQAFRPYQPRFITLPMDESGLQVEALATEVERLHAAGTPPRFLYTVATFQNPTGVTMSLERRHALLDIAERYGLPIVEDDPYGELRYSGETLPSISALDIARHGEPRHVLYTSTFSKLLAPGLRVGWVIAPEEVRRRIVQVKQGIDLHTGSLAQGIAYEACRDGLLDRTIPKIRDLYQARRDAMLAELAATMPTGVRWTKPDGGMFLWVTLPAGKDATELLARAIERHVAFVPGSSFHANGGGENTLRLNFSYMPPHRITEGVRRIAASM